MKKRIIWLPSWRVELYNSNNNYYYLPACTDAQSDNGDYGDNPAIPARKDAATATTRKRSHTINTTAACVFI